MIHFRQYWKKQPLEENKEQEYKTIPNPKQNNPRKLIGKHSRNQHSQITPIFKIISRKINNKKCYCDVIQLGIIEVSHTKTFLPVDKINVLNWRISHWYQSINQSFNRLSKNRLAKNKDRRKSQMEPSLSLHSFPRLGNNRKGKEKEKISIFHPSILYNRSIPHLSTKKTRSSPCECSYISKSSVNRPIRRQKITRTLRLRYLKTED